MWLALESLEGLKLPFIHPFETAFNNYQHSGIRVGKSTSILKNSSVRRKILKFCEALMKYMMINIETTIYVLVIFNNLNPAGYLSLVEILAPTFQSRQ